MASGSPFSYSFLTRHWVDEAIIALNQGDNDPAQAASAVAQVFATLDAAGASS